MFIIHVIFFYELQDINYSEVLYDFSPVCFSSEQEDTQV